MLQNRSNARATWAPLQLWLGMQNGPCRITEMNQKIYIQAEYASAKDGVSDEGEKQLEGWSDAARGLPPENPLEEFRSYLVSGGRDANVGQRKGSKSAPLQLDE